MNYNLIMKTEEDRKKERKQEPNDNEWRAMLHDLIVKEVFVTKETERIVNVPGEADAHWLFDFRRIILRGNTLDAIAQLCLEKAVGETKMQVGGVETAAIPLIAAVVMKAKERGISMNGFFVRKSRKKTGLLSMMEGVLTDEPILLVDDLMNSGGSLLRQVVALEELGKKVAVIFTILRFYDEDHYTEFSKRGIRIVSLFSLDDFHESLGLANFVSQKKTPVLYPYKMKWKWKSEGAHFEYVIPKSQPALSDGVLYVGSDSGNFWAIDAKDGTVRWSYRVLFGAQNKLIFSSPAVHNDTVFFGAYDGNLYALDKHTGKKKWVAMDADWIGSSPCVAAKLGLVYVGMEFGFWKHRGGVAAYDIETGRRVWQSRSTMVTHGSPCYSAKHNMVVCGSNDGKVYGLNAKTGEEVYIYDAKEPVRSACVLSPNEQYVAFGSFNKQYVVLETKTGKVVREWDTLEANYSNPAFCGDDILIGASLDKHLYAWSITSGAVLWKSAFWARIFASPVVSEGKVYCGNNEALLRVLDAKTGKLEKLFVSTERITNAVIVDKQKNLIYVPTFANEIIAIHEDSPSVTL